MHATHTPLQTPPTQTVGSPDLLCVRVCVYPLCVRPLHFTSTQSINPEIVFTLHIIGGHLGGVLQAVFPAVHSGMPVPHIRVVDTLFDSSQRGTHSHRYSHTLVGISNPTTSFQGSTASQLFLATTTLRVLSLFFCRRVLSHCASMLLTLDHWTKIDSTAAAAAFQLFLFYPLFHSIPHSLYQFAFTFLHISSFANHCFPLKLLLVPLSLSVHSTLLLALVYSAISAAAAPHDDVDGQLLLLVLSGPLKWPKYNPAGTTSSCCTTTSRSIPVSDVP